MEERLDCGDGRKRYNYPALLIQNVQTLKEQIEQVQNRRDRRWASAEEKIRKQRDVIRNLEKEKIDIIRIINTLKAVDSYGQSPRAFSWKTYETRMQQIEDLEEEMRRLNMELSEKGTKYWKLQKDLSYAYMCRKKSLELKERTFHKESRIAPLLQTFKEQRDSCKELQASIRSILYIRSAFHKRQKNVRLLLSEGQYDLQEVVHAATIAYHTKQRELKYKLKLLCERTKVDRRQISEGIAEIKALIANDQKFKELNVAKLKKERVSEESYDPFSEKCRGLSYAEKKIRCEVILSRIFHESGEREIRYVCRKYSENEMENRRIFERIETTTSDTEKLLHEIRALKIEIKQKSRQKDDNSKAQKAEFDEIEETTEKVRLESNKLEALVDRADEILAYTKRLIRSMMDAAAPKLVLEKLRKISIDYDLMLYLAKLEESVKLLMKCLSYVVRMQTMAKRYTEYKTLE